MTVVPKAENCVIVGKEDALTRCAVQVIWIVIQMEIWKSFSGFLETEIKGHRTLGEISG